VSFDVDELREEIGREFAAHAPTPQEAIERMARFLFRGEEYLTERPVLVGSLVEAARRAYKAAAAERARARRAEAVSRPKPGLVQLERCSERGCPFYAMPGYRWCFRHARGRSAAAECNRRCTGPCGRELPPSEFHRHPNAAGRHPRCRQCRSAEARARRAA
jgi:hypothetical protein